MNYLVIYPGRFHPFHRGHRASYEYLAKKYGADHVYIATTGVQAPVTSPFTFADKVKMITTLGIPAGHVVKVTNPYQSREITDSIPTEEKSKTVLIFALSAKDAERFNFAPKKDGTPSYLQPMPENVKQLKPMTEHAYVEITPTVNFKVRGKDANSASQIREFYIKGNNNDRDQVIADLYSEAYPELRDIFDNRLGVSEQVQKIVREAKLLNTTKSIALIERILTKERRALNEFGVNSGDEDSSNDPYQYPKPEQYRRSVDFFGQFEAEHFDEEDMNDVTGEFKGYWDYDGKLRQIAYFKFDNPKRTGSNDPGMGWYYEPQNEGIAETKKKKKKKTSRSLGRYFFPGYGYYGSGESGEGGDGGGESVNRGMTEGMAQDEAEETNGWRAELVNQIKYNTFEVKMTNTRSKESANFIVRPVDMISIGPTLQIETMDVHDLQTGRTESWTSDDPQPDGGIVYAIAMMFWDNKQLQKKLWNIVDTHNTKGQDLMPGLDQRRSIGQEVDADAYIDSQEKTQAALTKMKQGPLNEFDPGEGGFGPFKVYVGDEFLEEFATFDQAKEEIEFLRTADPKSFDADWKIIDSAGKTVWQHDPGEAIDAMRMRRKIQFKKPDDLKEFAPGNGSGKSGRWYTDSELADIIGDDWFEDFDVSNDGFNMDAHGEKAKQNLVGYANAWFDDKGYNVNVLGVENNEVDHDLQWYIVGSFYNPGFAKKGMAETEKTAKVFHPQYVDVYFLDGPRKTPTLVNRRVPYNLIDQYLELVTKKYNLQQGRFEFRNAEEPHMAEQFKPTTGQAMNIRRQTAQKMNPVTNKFVWKRPNQIGGSHSENQLKSLNFKHSTKYNMWGGTQQMWDRLSGALKESTDYLEEK